MNHKEQIIKKYTRTGGSWGTTKDFIVAEDVPKMLDELMEQQPQVSEEALIKEAKVFLLSNTPDIQKAVKSRHWAAYRMAKFALHLQSHHPQPISEERIEELNKPKSPQQIIQCPYKNTFVCRKYCNTDNCMWHPNND
jgi:hypothetical protein